MVVLTTREYNSLRPAPCVPDHTYTSAPAQLTAPVPRPILHSTPMPASDSLASALGLATPSPAQPSLLSATISEWKWYCNQFTRCDHCQQITSMVLSEHALPTGNSRTTPTVNQLQIGSCSALTVSLPLAQSHGLLSVAIITVMLRDTRWFLLFDRLQECI